MDHRVQAVCMRGIGGGLLALLLLIALTPGVALAQGTAQISGGVWLDLDANGIRGSDEPGLAGVGVRLTDLASITLTAVTDAGGHYSFSGLLPAAYVVSVNPATLPTDAVPTFDVDGGLDARAVVTPTAGSTLGNINFGFVSTRALVSASAWHFGYLCPGWGQRYTIVVRNDSSILAPNVVVRATVPELLRYSDTNYPDGTPTGGSYNPTLRQVSWSLGDLAPGAIRQVTLHAYIVTSAPPSGVVDLRIIVESAGQRFSATTATFAYECVLPTATQTLTPTRSATPSATTPVDTPTNTHTPTATLPGDTPTNTHTPTATMPGDTPTNTYTLTATLPGDTPTNTHTPTATLPGDTPTNTHTPTATMPGDTPTNTYTPTATMPGDTPTSTYTPTPTTPGDTPTNTHTPTATLPGDTPTNTPTPTATLPGDTPTNTPTPTPTLPGDTPTNTHTPTPTVPVDTVTPTSTPTATQPPTPTPLPRRICQASHPEGVILYRVEGSELFQPYGGSQAHLAPLQIIPAPPAPAGWNLPDYVPGEGWRPADAVMWDAWDYGGWAIRPPGADILGLKIDGVQDAVDGTTHLLRSQVTLHTPAAGWRVTSVQIQTWSDNKAAWYWDGKLVRTDLQGPIGWLELFPAHVKELGGSYTLAIQNSNDYQRAPNPHGTAWEICTTWEWGPADWYLPLILRTLP